jgi:hypothetical protein
MTDACQLKLVTEKSNSNLILTCNVACVRSQLTQQCTNVA